MDYSDIVEHGPYVTMMVADCPLSEPIDLRLAFVLLPVVRMSIISIKKNQKLPHCSAPGSIISMRYLDERRGIIRDDNENYFKHCISIDISCQDKNVNIKLSEKNMHLCGATSIAMLEEAVDYIIEYIREIRDMLNYGNKMTDTRDKTINWLKDVSKGLEVIETRTQKNGNLKLKINRRRNLLRPVSGSDLKEAPDQKLALLYLRLSHDMVYHVDFCTMLDWIKNAPHITGGEFDKKEVMVKMRNTNSQLRFGMGISFIFAQVYSKHFPQYSCFYDNSIRGSPVTVKIKYQPTQKQIDNGKKEKDCYHTFKLQLMGSLKHSGPGGEESEHGYQKFIESMRQMKEILPHYLNNSEYIETFLQQHVFVETK